MALAAGIKRNLEVQGFRCDALQFELVEPWLRFNPAICFLVAVLGLSFASPSIFFWLAAFAAFGVISPHSLGDLIYNRAIRFLTKTPPLPPNPPPRRFACFIGSTWSIAVALAFLFGYSFLAYALGIVFLLVVIPMIFWHYCIASLIYQKFIGYHPA